METTFVERARLNARGQDGAIYELIECQIVTTAAIDGVVKTTKGGVVYRLADGRDVHWVDETSFRIPDTEQLLTRV